MLDALPPIEIHERCYGSLGDSWNHLSDPAPCGVIRDTGLRKDRTELVLQRRNRNQAV